MTPHWFPWNGSKRWLLNDLIPIIEQWDGKGRYFEPFLGSGVLSAAVRSRFLDSPHFLSDLNPWLLSAFEHQKLIVLPEIAQGLSAEDWLLQEHPTTSYILPENYQDYSYWRKLTDADFSSLEIKDRATRFAICLLSSWGNRWLVNKEGFFYGPLAKKEKIPPTWMARRLMDFFSVKWLNDQDTIRRASWEEAVSMVEPGDLVYLDPPYPETTGYENVWKIKDLLDVIDWSNEAIKRGVRIINSNVSDLERLYSRAGMQTKLVRFEKGCKTRRAREEVIAWAL